MKLVGVVFIGLIFSAITLPQDASKLKPLPEKASLAETQKWLTEAIGKAASYKAGRASVKASNVKIDGCKVSFVTSKQSDSSVTETIGSTKTITSVKNNISLDLAQFRAERISIADNLYPNLMNIVFRRIVAGETPGKPVEFAVKAEDSERVLGGFRRLASLCEERKQP